jgi:hypothetical protein
MRTVLMTLAMVALAAVGFTAAASGRSNAPNRQQAGSQTFTDPTGDAVNDAPDITTITVSNDDAGNIGINIAFSNRFSDLKDNDGFEVIMDTDQNASTGSGGFDYIYIGIKDRNGLFVWNGSSFGRANANSVHGTSGNGQAGFTVNRADLGNATVLRFWVLTTRDLGESFGDDAPNGNGVFVYSLALPSTTPPPPTTTTTTTTTPPPPPPPPPQPTPTPKFVVTPAGSPHAGKRFVVRVRVAVGDLSALPTAVTCTARAGSVPVKTTGQKESGPFRDCVLVVPAGTAGKSLVIVLKLRFKATATTRTLRFKIR